MDYLVEPGEPLPAVTLDATIARRAIATTCGHNEDDSVGRSATTCGLARAANGSSHFLRRAESNRVHDRRRGPLVCHEWHGAEELAASDEIVHVRTGIGAVRGRRPSRSTTDSGGSWIGNGGEPLAHPARRRCMMR
jgi:hypothetical protein